MEYLRNYFDITIFYYNPNISADSEYQKRVLEEKRLIELYNNQVDEYEKTDFHKNKQALLMDGDMSVSSQTHRINIIEGDYNPSEFYNIAKGYEKCEEGGERCFRCFELRLRRSFEVAREIGADYVTSTLTISPLKNAAKINEIGYMLRSEFAENDLTSPDWLPSDFKKKNGYKRSIELSETFGLYRQNYCGCVYSIRAKTE